MGISAPRKSRDPKHAGLDVSSDADRLDIKQARESALQPGHIFPLPGFQERMKELIILP